MVNLQISDTAAAVLSAQAAACGLTVEAYLETLLLGRPAGDRHELSVAEIDRLLDEEATLGRSPSGTFSRTDIYGDHD